MKKEQSFYFLSPHQRDIKFALVRPSLRPLVHPSDIKIFRFLIKHFRCNHEILWEHLSIYEDVHLGFCLSLGLIILYWLSLINVGKIFIRRYLWQICVAFISKSIWGTCKKFGGNINLYMKICTWGFVYLLD